MKIKCAWMYHDIMDLYGDKGNIMTLSKRVKLVELISKSIRLVLVKKLIYVNTIFALWVAVRIKSKLHSFLIY